MESYNLNPEEKWKIAEESIVGKILKEHNKGFSEPEVITQKIKKIREKKKSKNNYKNIELFDNIHDIDSTSFPGPTIIEGLSEDGIARFSEKDYEGGKDNIYEGGDQYKSVNRNGGLVGLIETTFDNMRILTYKIAYFIVKNFSKSGIDE